MKKKFSNLLMDVPMDSRIRYRGEPQDPMEWISKRK